MSVSTEVPVLSIDDARAPYVLLARYRKARVIATMLASLPDATINTVVGLGNSEAGRTLAARCASVNVPSATTWVLVIEMFKEARL